MPGTHLGNGYGNGNRRLTAAINGRDAEILTPRPAAIVDKAGCKAAGYWPLAGGRAANRSVPTNETKNAAFAAFGVKMVGTRRFELRTP